MHPETGASNLENLMQGYLFKCVKVMSVVMHVCNALTTVTASREYFNLSLWSGMCI